MSTANEPDPAHHERAAETVRAAVAAATTGLVDREIVAESVVLCAVAGEHLLIVGPPGTAKSEAVRRMAAGTGGRYFEYLLGRFTEPNEIFGPVDLRRLREGVVEFDTAGMLPDAQVAFLDEVFLGSTAVLNTLLGLLNERIFRRGSTVKHSDLRVCVGACNHLPDDPALAAFADRFLARLFVEPVADARLEELLLAGDTVAVPAPDPAQVGVALTTLTAAAAGADLTGVRPLLATCVRRVRQAGVMVTDRRAVRSQRLVAAAAVLDGRTVADESDLWVLPLVAPSADAQPVVRDVLADLVATGRNRTLLHAAEEFARGRAARADRLVRSGTALLQSGPIGPHPDDRLRVEATLREIDAAFAPEQLPDDLQQVRQHLLVALAPAS